MLRHFRQAGWAAMLYYTYRMGHAGVFRGRHLFLSGSTKLTTLPASGAAVAGDITGIASLNLPPLKSITFGTLAGGDADDRLGAKLDAIAAQTVGRDITMRTRPDAQLAVRPGRSRGEPGHQRQKPALQPPRGLAQPGMRRRWRRADRRTSPAVRV